jgi:dTDP-glucose pyrophosphorylase
MIDKNQYCLTLKHTIKDALTLLNEVENGWTVFIIDDTEKLVGVVTDGDIRRGLLNDFSLSDTVEPIMKRDFKYVQRGQLNTNLINEYRLKGIKMLPFLDADFKIERLLDLTTLRSIIPVDALIMAGGRGERLRPLTDDNPKPMLLVGDKPILEHNIDRLILFGIEQITISIKYKGDIIRNHFMDGTDKGVNIKYIEEKDALGTIGALSLIEDFTNDTVLIMNSDLLTNIDFEDFYTDFITKNADMSVASIPYKVDIPYGVLETEGDHIISLKEKPSYTYFSNAGIYLIRKELLSLIPYNSHYNATDLMTKIIETEGKLITYPILQYWLDIGKHEDYKKAQEDIKHINF